MKPGYEDALTDLQSEYISLCLEYAEGTAEEGGSGGGHRRLHKCREIHSA